MYKTSVNYDFFLIINSIILEEFYVAIKLIEMQVYLKYRKYSEFSEILHVALLAH